MITQLCLSNNREINSANDSISQSYEIQFIFQKISQILQYLL
jgi:hypothetical protein